MQAWIHPFLCHSSYIDTSWHWWATLQNVSRLIASEKLRTLHHSPFLDQERHCVFLLRDLFHQLRMNAGFAAHSSARCGTERNNVAIQKQGHAMLSGFRDTIQKIQLHPREKGRFPRKSVCAIESIEEIVTSLVAASQAQLSRSMKRLSPDYWMCPSCVLLYREGSRTEGNTNCKIANPTSTFPQNPLTKYRPNY